MKVSADGIVALHVSIKIDVNEMKNWTPERITALFDGMAQVRNAAAPPRSRMGDIDVLETPEVDEGPKIDLDG